MAHQQKPGKKKSSKGELRRRWRLFLEDGSMAALRSEGRLVALYVLQIADWSTCEAKFSMSRAASCMDVHKNTISRGLAQLVEAGILEVLQRGGPRGSGKYRVAERPRAVDAASTSGGHQRPRAVYAASTSGGRVDHEAWTQRLRAVGAASTSGRHDSVFISGSPVRTSERTSDATASDGEPSEPCPPSRDGEIPAAAG